PRSFWVVLLVSCAHALFLRRRIVPPSPTTNTSAADTAHTDASSVAATGDVSTHQVFGVHGGIPPSVPESIGEASGAASMPASLLASDIASGAPSGIPSIIVI